MTKTIYLTRHAQGYHNVADDYTIADANLTPLGRQQCSDLNNATKDKLQKSADLLVSSALRRTIQTTLDGYPALRKRLGGKIVLLPELQEVNDLPCDTGSSREFLEQQEEFADLDFSTLDASEKEHGVKWTSKQGFFAPENVIERGRWVRRWLRSRPEQHIVVVAHGDLLRVVVDGARSDPATHPWANAEIREYRFQSEDAEDAKLVPVKEIAKEGEEEPTSSEMPN